MDEYTMRANSMALAIDFSRGREISGVDLIALANQIYTFLKGQ